MEYISFSARFSRKTDGTTSVVAPGAAYIGLFFHDYFSDGQLDAIIANIDSMEEWSAPGNYLETEGSKSHVELYPYPDKGDFILHPSQFRALLVDFKDFSKSDLESDYREYPAPDTL